MFILAAVVALLSLFLSVLSHPQPGVRAKQACSEHPAAQSYHIHVMFWQNNKNSTAAALQLQADFMENFNLTAENNTCSFGPNELQPTASMCVFDVHYEPSGPFVTAQTTLFIPVADYERSVSWLVPRRGVLDVFVHPNSGCSPQDHMLDSLWAGNKWEIDASIFTD